MIFKENQLEIIDCGLSVPYTENKGTGPAGEGVLLKITVGVCSMLPESLTLP